MRQSNPEMVLTATTTSLNLASLGKGVYGSVGYTITRGTNVYTHHEQRYGFHILPTISRSTCH
jgi:hypothetical protein